MRSEVDTEPVVVIHLPTFVVEKWREAEGTPLAKMTIEGGPTPTVSLQLQGEYAKDLPKNFTGRLEMDDTKLFEEIETRDGNGSCTKISGPVIKVETRLQMRTFNPETGKMEVDKNFRGLAKEKDAEEKRKARKLVTRDISFADGRNRMTKLPTIKNRRMKNQVYISSKAKRDKRVCRDSSDVERELFDLFEKQEKWALGQLQNRTEQPLGHLKTIVLGIAELITTGPYADMYQLKPEYRRHQTSGKMGRE